MLVPILGFQSLAVPCRTACPSRVNGLILPSLKKDAEDNDGGLPGFYPPEFYRAVECANRQGLCDADELLGLASELEKYNDSCFFEFQKAEDDDDDCEKEILDRLDVADLLRAEGELQQRRNAVEFNSFKGDVEKRAPPPTGQRQQEQPPKDVIESVSNFYECIYSKSITP
jgi:hypothetical protein